MWSIQDNGNFKILREREVVNCGFSRCFSCSGRLCRIDGRKNQIFEALKIFMFSLVQLEMWERSVAPRPFPCQQEKLIGILGNRKKANDRK